MTRTDAQLLVATPDGFAFRQLLRQKLDSITQNLNITIASLLGDSNGLAKEYFDSKNIPTTHIKRERNAKNQFKNVSHAILFWDGRDYSDLIHYAMKNGIQYRVIAVDITSVVNKDKSTEFDVYIGRGTPWGNPFPIGFDEDSDSRKEVIAKYKEYFYKELITDKTKLRALLSLQGKRLGCHCKPLPCHGDIIADFLNSYEAPETES